MPMPQTHSLYLVRKPGEIVLASLDGQIVMIVDNYTEVFETPPQITDGVSRAFVVEVPHDEVIQRMDNGVNRLFLWKGDPKSRERPHDKHQLPVQSLMAMSKGDPAEMARSAFAELPEEVRLAAIIEATADATLTKLPDIGPERITLLRTWAQNVLIARGAAQG